MTLNMTLCHGLCHSLRHIFPGRAPSGAKAVMVCVIFRFHVFFAFFDSAENCGARGVAIPHCFFFPGRRGMGRAHPASAVAVLCGRPRLPSVPPSVVSSFLGSVKFSAPSVVADWGCEEGDPSEPHKLVACPSPRAARSGGRAAGSGGIP